MKIEIASMTATRRSAAMLLTGACLCLAATAHSDIDTADVIYVQDASAKADRGSFDRRTDQMKYMATLINRTDADIVGPVYVHVRNISEPGVLDVDHDATFSDGRGLYLVDIDLEPDELIKKEFTFYNPDRKKFQFKVDMWVDAASNPDIPPPN